MARPKVKLRRQSGGQESVQLVLPEHFVTRRQDVTEDDTHLWEGEVSRKWEEETQPSERDRGDI